MYTNYEDLLEVVLRENQILLFDLNGEEKEFDYQRHVSGYMNEYKRLSKGQKTATAIQFTLDVWASWEIHIRKSSYSLAYYSGVHIEDNWLKSGRGVPPCIILLNRPVAQKDETAEEPPVQINWTHERVLGPVTIRSLVYLSRKRQYRAWRIYLSDTV